MRDSRCSARPPRPTRSRSPKSWRCSMRWSDAGLPVARMMPGTGCCALTDTVELTRHAIRHGCAGVLMLPPFYYKGVTDDGLYASYSEVIQRVGDARLRIYLYHIPQVSQVPLVAGADRATAGRVSRHRSPESRTARATGTACAGCSSASPRAASRSIPAARRCCSPPCAAAAPAASAHRRTSIPAAIVELYRGWQRPDADAAAGGARRAAGGAPEIPGDRRTQGAHRALHAATRSGRACGRRWSGSPPAERGGAWSPRLPAGFSIAGL